MSFNKEGEKMNAIQQRIVARMNEYGIKQAELAAAAGLKNPCSVSQHLNSSCARPSTLEKLEKALDDVIANGGKKPLSHKKPHKAKGFPHCNKNCQFAEEGLCTILIRADKDCNFFKAKEKTA